MTPEAYPPEDRVRKRSEYRWIQSRGRRIHTPHFILIVMPRADGERRRLGITVSKKVSSSAVGRNRVKRLVREAFRRNRDLFPPESDVVIIAKRGAPELSQGDVLGELRRARNATARAVRR